MALLRHAGRTALNIGKEIAKTPVRLTYSLIDVPRVLAGKEPLPKVNLRYLGDAQSAQRRAYDLAQQERQTPLTASLRAGGEAMLDVAAAGGLAKAAVSGLSGGAASGAAKGGAYRYLDHADDIMKETDELLKANPSMVRSAPAIAPQVAQRAGVSAGGVANAVQKGARTVAKGEYIPKQQFKNAHPEDVKEIVKFIDDVRLPKRTPSIRQQVTLTRLAERFGINPNQSPAKIANAFAKKLEANPTLLKK